MGTIHINDEGTLMSGTVTDDAGAVDISSASVKNMVFLKPDGTLVTKAGAFGTNGGTDGVLEYTVETAFLDCAGTWKRQIYVEMPTGKWYTDEDEFEVADNLEAV